MARTRYPFDEDGLRFEHELQHGPASEARLEAWLARSPWTLPQALSLADELVGHAHRHAWRAIDPLERAGHADVRAHARRLQACLHALRQEVQPESCDRRLVEQAYGRNGWLLLSPPQPSTRMLVVFTTMFNNFYVSNLVLLTLLQRLGCHLLLLKDATLANYLAGVAGLAADLPGIAAAVRSTATRLGARQIFVCGFSSGGYAALYTALQIHAQGYLGLSHAIDLRPDSSLPAPLFFTPAVRSRLDPAAQVDLRTLLRAADPHVPRWLMYGEHSLRDRPHALHVSDLPTIEVLSVPDAGHNVVQALLASGRFIEAFVRLTTGR